MTKKNNTKRSLLMSVLVLVLCFAMLIGGTFAWFSDNAATNDNKVQSGILAVDLLMADANGNYTSIDKKAAAIFGAESLTAKNDPAATLWEPGKTQIVYLAVDNEESNLDLKYCITLEVEGGLVGALEYAIVDGAKAGDINAASWAEVKSIANVQTGDIAAGTLVAAPNGVIKSNEGAEYFALAVHMKETAGNEYQGKDITIDVTVLATQLDSEADVFGNTYDVDADALYIVDEGNTKNYVATGMNSLSEVAMLASNDDTINSVTYLTPEGAVEAPVVRDAASLNNAISSTTRAVDGEEKVIVLAEGNFDNIDLYSSALARKSLTIVGAGAGTKVRFGNQQVRAELFDRLTISHCTIDKMFTKKWGQLVFSTGKQGGVYTVSNCIFNGVGTQGIFINENNSATYNIVNCIFDGGESNADFGEGAITISNNNGVDFTVNVTGCEFINMPETSYKITVQTAYKGWTLNAPEDLVYWAKG